MAMPLWILRSITQPYGSRLPKVQLLAKPKTNGSRYLPMIYQGDDDWNGGNTIWTANDREIVNGKVVDGNLENQEYEFFMGSAWADAQRAVCRFCGETMWVKALRKEHFAKTDCSQNIKKIAALLRRDKKCVICDTGSNRTIYGLPICKVECLAKFKFAQRTTTAYESAKTMLLRSRT